MPHNKLLFVPGVLFIAVILSLSLAALYWYNSRPKPGLPPRSDTSLNLQTTKLSNRSGDSISFSVNGRQVAYKVHVGDPPPAWDPFSWLINSAKALTVQLTDYVVEVNGSKISPVYEEINDVTFSPDGNKIGYTAFDQKKGFVVVGDKRLKEHDNRVHGLEFSNDGLHTAYVLAGAHKDKDYVSGYAVIYDGKIGKAYDRISELQFIPGTSKIAYIACRNEFDPNEECFVVIGNDEKQLYKEVRGLTFSSDGLRSAHVAQDRSGSYFLSINGQVGLAYGYIWNPVISANNQHVAYAVKTNENEVAIFVDRTEKARSNFGVPDIRDDFPVSSVAVSSDGQKVAYAIWDKSRLKEFAISDNQEVAAHDSISGMQYSPNNKLVFIFSDYPAKYKPLGPQRLWINGSIGEPYDWIVGPVKFTNDGNQVVYGAKTDEELWWVSDKVEWRLLLNNFVGHIE